MLPRPNRPPAPSAQPLHIVGSAGGSGGGGSHRDVLAAGIARELLVVLGVGLLGRVRGGAVSGCRRPSYPKTHPARSPGWQMPWSWIPAQNARRSASAGAAGRRRLRPHSPPLTSARARPARPPRPARATCSTVMVPGGECARPGARAGVGAVRRGASSASGLIIDYQPSSIYQSQRPNPGHWTTGQHRHAMGSKEVKNYRTQASGAAPRQPTCPHVGRTLGFAGHSARCDRLTQAGQRSKPSVFRT